MSQMDVEDDKKSGCAMDIEHTTTRTLGEVNYDLKGVAQQMKEVKQNMQEAEAAYLKSNNDFFMLKWQGLQSQLEGLQDEKKSLLRQQELLLQQPTAPSSGKTPTRTPTPLLVYSSTFLSHHHLH